MLNFIRKYLLYPIFTEEEVQHYFTPREDIVDTYVIEEKKGDNDGLITDFVSFYTVPSTVIKHDTIKEIKVYML
jgi:glycylpeptide N-tetradecanoyltransferase